MTCAETREQFSARADDALSAAARAALEVHLAGCPECRREWQRFAATVGLLRAVEPARAPAGFADRVLAAARPEPWYRRLARGLLVPWPVKLPLEAAALVMVAALTVLIFQRSPELQQMAEAPEPPGAAPPGPAETLSGSAQLLSRPDADTSKDAALGVLPAPTLTDSRSIAAVAKPDAGRSEAEAPPIAQPQEQELVPTRRQQFAKSAPEGRAAAPAPANLAATAESAEATRSKRQEDKLAKEAERDVGSGFLAAVGRKAEAPESQVQRLAVRAAPAAVELSLAVTDRAATERDVAAIVQRLGGAVVAGPAPGTLEIMVPGRAFAPLTGDLARLGTLRIVRQPAELPESVGISLRLTD
ncbi:MAG TPA: zf-HC2 domain-containing protein [Candidatus Binatia bacterium]|nr:zf-HC2 domain-containing protein [Candidatus Binatia bacterium]